MAWTGKNDDKTLVDGNYTLRAEKMDTEKFWWTVYFNGDEIAGSSLLGKFANTMSKAQYWAMYYKMRHKKTK